MLAPVATILGSFAVSALACQPGSGFKMTFYGWPDNSPPGNKVSMNCGGRGGKASGIGTYAEPLTMAAEKGRFSECELVYSPYLKKYLRMEDTCATCSGDWVDVWTGSSTSNPGSGVKKCQESLTGKDAANHAIIRAPPNNLEVAAAELYANGVCNTAVVFPSNAGNTACTGGATTGETTTGGTTVGGLTSGKSSEGSETVPTVPSLPDSADSSDSDDTPKSSGKGRKGGWRRKGSRKWRSRD